MISNVSPAIARCVLRAADHMIMLRPSTSTSVISARFSSTSTTSSRRHSTTSANAAPATAAATASSTSEPAATASTSAVAEPIAMPVVDQSVVKKANLLGEFALIDNAAPDADRKPLVIMLGWGGARDKQLGKFSDMYQKKGYPRYGNELHSAIADNLSNRPILLHVFSMNGCNVLLSLLDILNRTQDGSSIKKQMRGIILDSGPADVTPAATAMAIALSAFPPGANALSRAAVFSVVATYFLSQRLNVWFQHTVLGRQSAYSDNFGFFKMMESNDIPKQQLYLYSKKDAVCGSASVEKFIQSQKSKDAVQEIHCFNNSHHVQHFRKNPEVYYNSCMNFASRLLEKEA